MKHLKLLGWGRCGLPRFYLDICAHTGVSPVVLTGDANAAGHPAGTDLPQFFEVPPIDITGGVDAADYVQEQREGDTDDPPE